MSENRTVKISSDYMARKFSNEKIARKIKNSYMVGGGICAVTFGKALMKFLKENL